MWDYLSKLHPLLPYSLIILAMIAIVIIALKGKLMIKWGKNAIGIGNAGDSEGKKPSSTGTGTGTSITPVPPGTVYLEKKRSCSDCLHIITSEYEKYNFNKKIRADKVLTYRMNYTEEKLLEIENEIIALFDKRIDRRSNQKEKGLAVESKMFYGLLREVLYKVKKEIRRSCKENGFCELSELEFTNFINDKVKIIMSIITRELKKIYPAYDTIIPIDTIISDIESVYEDIHEYIKDIFVYAKQVIEENEKEAEEMRERFRKWLDCFIDEKGDSCPV